MGRIDTTEFADHGGGSRQIEMVAAHRKDDRSVRLSAYEHAIWRVHGAAALPVS